jgi:hypothetical protein
MDIEVGPGDEAYTSNMQVIGNWSEGHTATVDNVAFSLVQSHGVDTLVEGNYITASGTGPSIAIEMSGTGEITGNQVTGGFWWGTIVYTDGFNVHDNAFVNDGLTVVNYNNSNGIIQNNVTDPTDFSALRLPIEASATSSSADHLVGDLGTDLSALRLPIEASATSSSADQLVGDPGTSWNPTTGSEAIAVDVLGVNPDHVWNCYAHTA